MKHLVLLEQYFFYTPVTPIWEFLSIISFFFLISRKSSQRVLPGIWCAKLFSSRAETVPAKHCLQPWHTEVSSESKSSWICVTQSLLHLWKGQTWLERILLHVKKSDIEVCTCKDNLNRSILNGFQGWVILFLSHIFANEKSIALKAWSIKVHDFWLHN